MQQKRDVKVSTSMHIAQNRVVFQVSVIKKRYVIVTKSHSHAYWSGVFLYWTELFVYEGINILDHQKSFLILNQNF